jgi:hypothetical protein
MEKALVLISLIISVSLASIQVMHPKELSKKIGNDGYVKSSLGNFGHIVYGSSVV